MQEVDQILFELEQELGLSLANIRIVFSSEGLRLWELACCWIDESDAPCIQLRPQLQKGCYLGYTLREVIRHEVVHALRAHIPYSQFEELLACYIGSGNHTGCLGRFRRILSAFFLHPWEPFLFIFFSLLLPWYEYSSLLVVPFFALLFFLSFRLYIEWKKFIRQLKSGPISRILFFV